VSEKAMTKMVVVMMIQRNVRGKKSAMFIRRKIAATQVGGNYNVRNLFVHSISSLGRHETDKPSIRVNRKAKRGSALKVTKGQNMESNSTTGRGLVDKGRHK